MSPFLKYLLFASLLEHHLFPSSLLSFHFICPLLSGCCQIYNHEAALDWLWNIAMPLCLLCDSWLAESLMWLCQYTLQPT